MAIPGIIPATKSKASVLNSWKEIANYMGRGVRTVQRYERDFHLPVRRLPGKARGAVIAFPQDLDAWLRCAPSSEFSFELKLRCAAVVTTVEGSIHEGATLRERCHALREAHHLAIANLVRNVAGLVQTSLPTLSPEDKNDDDTPVLPIRLVKRGGSGQTLIQQQNP